VLSMSETRELERLARGRRIPVRLAQRSALVLLAAERKPDRCIRKQIVSL